MLFRLVLVIPGTKYRKLCFREAMKIKNFILLLFGCLAVFYATQVLAQGELVVRMNENSFPASFKTAKGWQGMDVDVLDELMSATDLNYKVVLMPFKRAMAEISKGQIDLLANLTKNAARSEHMHWIGPVRNTKVALVVKKRNQGPAINSFDELIEILEAKKQPIGHVMGVSYSPLLDENIANNTRLKAQIWHSSARMQIVEMLQKDRIFGFFQDQFEASSLITANKNDSSKPYSAFAIRQSNIDNSTSGAYFGVSKHLDQNKIDKLNQAFHRIQQDGTLQKIFDKWTGKTAVSAP
jgi:ABC-type amino acid transport substrate-binding protein